MCSFPREYGVQGCGRGRAVRGVQTLSCRLEKPNATWQGRRADADWPCQVGSEDGSPRPGHNVSPLQHQPSETLVHGNTKEGTKIKTAKKHLWVNDQTSQMVKKQTSPISKSQRKWQTFRRPPHPTWVFFAILPKIKPRFGGMILCSSPPKVFLFLIFLLLLAFISFKT